MDKGNGREDALKELAKVMPDPGRNGHMRQPCPVCSSRKARIIRMRRHSPDDQPMPVTTWFAKPVTVYSRSVIVGSLFAAALAADLSADLLFHDPSGVAIVLKAGVIAALLVLAWCGLRMDRRMREHEGRSLQDGHEIACRMADRETKEGE